ncbi:heterokaryon incompatibility protein-domain-containing protein [Cerioporus squamosus]|nr:heterokaryon incompatibility protein-domain-containing protein [Cerioporus squamosus]
MWLLSTDRAVLQSFASPEDVPDGYATLSHVWDEEEQSFQDVQRIERECASTGKNPRDLVSEKIRRCCELAESHGYKWVWIDTCCIDKTSSAELSEAINSMFRYYALADICYGYLRDVPFLADVRGADAEYFVQAKWFRRGWTLQELIAPRFFLFLSKSWQVLGTKADFAELIEDWSHIPATVLRFEVSHTEFSIAQRMSWFGAGRETTRLEDEAYCLLGLFDIHMPPLYGEGRNAFRRLQEEIMKQSADTTLFAWADSRLDDQMQSCLFAPSPSVFRIGNIMYTPPQRAPVWDGSTYEDPAVESRGGVANDMTFSVTPHGVLAYIPVYKLRGGDVLADLYWSTDRSHGRDAAVLHLEEDPDSQARSSVRPSYRVSGGVSRIHWTGTNGCFNSDTGEYVFGGEIICASWQEVLIRHRPPSHRLPGQLSDTRTFFIPPMPMQLVLDSPFRFDNAHIRKFMHEFGADCVHVLGAESQSSQLADSNLLTSYVFERSSSQFIVIQVGQCQRDWVPGDLPRPAPGPIWAKVRGVATMTASPRAKEEAMKFARDPSHNCLEDHVSRWPTLRKRFHLNVPWFLLCTMSPVILTFTACPISPERTLLLDASLHDRKNQA